MNASLLILFIIQVILIFILALFFHSIFKESRTLNIENRLTNFSIPSIDEQSSPFFERFFDKIWCFIRRFNKVFEKSDFFTKYSKRFDKYIIYKNVENRSGFDYISLKFITSFIFGLLYIISTIIQKNYNSMFLLLVMCLSFFIIDIYLLLEYKKRKKDVEHDLLNAIIIMNNAFKSGMNIMQAVEVVKNEMSGPIQEEFIKISMDISYGLSLEVVFERFYNRVKIEDIKYITSSLSLINRTGGNIVRVFGAIEKNFYDKKKIIDEMNSLTSSSIFMFRLLTIMPILLCFILFLLNPHFFIPFFVTGLGRIIFFSILLLFGIYILIIKRIMRVGL